MGTERSHVQNVEIWGALMETSSPKKVAMETGKAIKIHKLISKQKFWYLKSTKRQ